VFEKQFRKGAVNRVTSFFQLSAWAWATVIGRIFVIFHIRDICQKFFDAFRF